MKTLPFPFRRHRTLAEITETAILTRREEQGALKRAGKERLEALRARAELAARR
jgi:hypothetical protein